MKWFAAVCMFCLLLAGSAIAGDWPAFRGPSGNGLCAESGFPTEWSPEKNIKWRVPLPAPGNSSPIIVGDKVFVTCADAEGKERTLYAHDRTDGRELWKQTVTYGKVEQTHKTNPFCPTTPLSDGEQVYVWHGSAGMHAYTLDGSPVWSRDLGEFVHIWGLGSSPVLYGDTVIQLCGPGERTFVVALNRKTGETVWETAVEPGGSASDGGRYVGTWVTPVLTSVEGEDQLVCAYHTRVVGLDPKSGRELWSISGISSDRGDLVYASPMLSGTHGVVMGGFGGPEFGFKLGGSGDVTDSHRLWHHPKTEKDAYHPQRIGTGIVVGNHLFMADADGAGGIECLNMETGERTWSERRTKDGAHWGSMVLADGHLYVTGQKGITRVLKANPEKYEVVAENNLRELSNSTPAFSNGQIFLRTHDALYCVSEEP